MKKKVLVALGASSGGLAVLSEFFDHTLPDAVSYVITMHLHPEHRSLLAEILQKHSDLTVKEVQDRMTIRSNEVYVMPENKVMTIADGRLLLTPRNRAIKINNAIDIFLNHWQLKRFSVLLLSYFPAMEQMTPREYRL